MTEPSDRDYEHCGKPQCLSECGCWCRDCRETSKNLSENGPALEVGPLQAEINKLRAEVERLTAWAKERDNDAKVSTRVSEQHRQERDVALLQIKELTKQLERYQRRECGCPACIEKQVPEKPAPDCKCPCHEEIKKLGCGSPCGVDECAPCGQE